MLPSVRSIVDRALLNELLINERCFVGKGQHRESLSEVLNVLTYSKRVVLPSDVKTLDESVSCVAKRRDHGGLYFFNEEFEFRISMVFLALVYGDVAHCDETIRPSNSNTPPTFLSPSICSSFPFP